MLNEKIGITLKKIRMKLRYTQDEVSEITGIPQSTLSYWEKGTGDPPSSALIELCKVYGVSDIYSAFSEQSPDSHGVTTVNVFGTEQKVLDAYRKADYGTKKIIEKILDVQAEPATTEKNA